MLFGAGSDVFFGLRAKIKIVARNSPSTHSDRVSCRNGSIWTYARLASMTGETNLRQTVETNEMNRNKRNRHHEGLNGGAFRSTFRLRFVAILVHMMLNDNTYTRPRKHSSRGLAANEVRHMVKSSERGVHLKSTCSKARIRCGRKVHLSIATSGYAGLD